MKPKSRKPRTSAAPKPTRLNPVVLKKLIDENRTAVAGVMAKMHTTFEAWYWALSHRLDDREQLPIVVRKEASRLDLRIKALEAESTSPGGLAARVQAIEGQGAKDLAKVKQVTYRTEAVGKELKDFQAFEGTVRLKNKTQFADLLKRLAALEAKPVIPEELRTQPGPHAKTATEAHEAGRRMMEAQSEHHDAAHSIQTNALKRQLAAAIEVGRRMTDERDRLQGEISDLYVQIGAANTITNVTGDQLQRLSKERDRLAAKLALVVIDNQEMTKRLYPKEG